MSVRRCGELVSPLRPFSFTWCPAPEPAFAVCEERLVISRAALLTFLREIGLRRINQRQQIANAFSRALRSRISAVEQVAGEDSEDDSISVEIVAAEEESGMQLPEQLSRRKSIRSPTQPPPETIVRPSNAHMWLTPCNWHICNDGSGAELAVSTCPGAYLRVRWEGGPSSCDAVHIEVDTSALAMEYMSLSFSFDGREPLHVSLPFGRQVSEGPIAPTPLHCA